MNHPILQIFKFWTTVIKLLFCHTLNQNQTLLGGFKTGFWSHFFPTLGKAFEIGNVTHPCSDSVTRVCLNDKHQEPVDVLVDSHWRIESKIGFKNSMIEWAEKSGSNTEASLYFIQLFLDIQTQIRTDRQRQETKWAD